MNRATILVLLLLASLGALAFKLLQPLLSGQEAMQAEAVRLHRAAQPVHLAMTELYMSNGVWPRAADLTSTAGLPIDVLPNGVVRLRVQLPRYKLDSAFYHRPTMNGAGLRWGCVVNDGRLRAIVEAIPECDFDQAFDAAAFAVEDAAPKPKLAAGASAACPPADPAAPRPAHRAGNFTFTSLGGGAWLLMGNVNGFPLPRIWNQAARTLHLADPFWNAVGHTATPVGERAVLIAGGRQPDFTLGSETSNRLLLVAPCTGEVLGRGAMLVARYDHGAVALDEHRVMLIGGHGKAGEMADVEIVDSQTMQSTPAAPLREPRAEHLTVPMPFGRVMVIGGNRSSARPSTEVYEPATGEWTATGSLAEGRRGAMSAVALPDGRVLVTGGATPALGAAMASVELWDPTSGAWRQANPLITGRIGHASALLDDSRVMVAGGATGAFSEVYDPQTDSWALGPAEPPRHPDRANVFAPAADASLILAGLTVWNKPLERDVAPVAKGLRVWRKAPAIAALPDGRVLVAGGYTRGSVTRFAEIYDPASGTSVDTGQLNVARQEHRAFALPDGNVLVAGGKGAWTDRGENAQGPLPGELWNAKSGRWTLLPDLRLDNEQAAAATLLEDGHLLYPITERGKASSGEPARIVLMLWLRGTAEISEQGALEPPRGSFRMLALGSGRVLLAGGSEQSSTRSSSPAAALWDVARRAPIPIAQPDGLLPRSDQFPRPPVLARLRDGRAFVASGGQGAVYDPKLDRWSALSAPLPAHSKWLALPDGRLVFLDKRLGLMPDITLFDPLDGRKMVLRTTKSQCISEAALNARADLLLFTDDCLDNLRGGIEWRRVGG